MYPRGVWHVCTVPYAWPVERVCACRSHACVYVHVCACALPMFTPVLRGPAFICTHLKYHMGFCAGMYLGTVVTCGDDVLTIVWRSELCVCVVCVLYVYPSIA